MSVDFGWFAHTIKENRRAPVNRTILSLTLAGLVLLAPLARAAKDESSSDSQVASVPSNYEMVQAPTAYVLLHGGYDFVTQVYNNGGIFLRADVGFKNFLMLGFSANGTNIIGSGTILIQTPKLAVKLKPLDQTTAPFSLALGWDDRGYGVLNGVGEFVPGTQKGFYTVISREFPDLGYLQGHLGFNLIQFDNVVPSRDLGAFLGTSFSFTKPLVINLEADRIISSQWNFNANFVFNIENPLRVGMDFVSINEPSLFSRIIRIQYTGFF
jgi:hypothetical protein